MIKRISWIPTIILPVATAIIIAAWLGPFIQWFVRSTGAAESIVTPSSLAMTAMILASIYVTRFALNRDRSKKQRGQIVVGSGLFAIVLVLALTYGAQFPLGFMQGLLNWRDSISPEAFLLIILAVAWGLGVSVGRRDVLNDESFERWFYRGIAALAILALLNTSTHFVKSDDLLVSVLTFFSTAIATLALINIERTRRQQKDYSSPWRRIYRQWLTTIISAVALILFGGLVLTGLVSPETVNRFIVVIQPLIDALASFVTAILTFLYTVAAWLLTPILPILQWIAQLIFSVIMAGLTFLHNLGLFVDRVKIDKDFQNFLNSPTFVSISRGAMLIIILFVIALVAIWGLRRSGLLAKKQADEIRDSIASRQLLWKQIKDLLSRLRSRTSTLPPFYLTLDGSQDDPRILIRRTYRSMLDWARGYGYPRFPFQTPSIYADALSRKLPHVKEPIDALTRSYLLARYSIDPLPPDEATRAQAAFDQMLVTPPSSATRAIALNR
jgi:uncharacterized protein DUF4129